MKRFPPSAGAETLPAYVPPLAAATFASPAASLAARMALRYFTIGHEITNAAHLIASIMIAFAALRKELTKMWALVFFWRE